MSFIPHVREVFHYTFRHGGLAVYISVYFSATDRLWLKSVPDFSILFSHGGLWLKSISDFIILFSHGGLTV
jgi:hypothetical protein